MKYLISLLLVVNLLNAGNTFPELEPKEPVLKKICVYSKVEKPYGYSKYSIFEDKRSDKVVIFSKAKDKLYTTKGEMKKYNLYNCNNLLEIIFEMDED